MKAVYYYGLNSRPVIKDSALPISELLQLSNKGIIGEHVTKLSTDYFSIVKDGKVIFQMNNITHAQFLNELRRHGL
jgi:Ethanolamine utilization protein EutJ (predicted chaperonin)